MDSATVTALAAVMFFIAILYAAVGQAGASGYLGVMALFSISPEIMKPAALVLNIVVATIAMVKFYRAGHFCWRTFWPFALGSIPFAFLGGAVTLPGSIYKPVVAAVLLLAAYRLFRVAGSGQTDRPITEPLVWAAILWGAAIGFLAGLTGIGGGIVLSPLLLFMAWAGSRRAAALEAAGATWWMESMWEATEAMFEADTQRRILEKVQRGPGVEA